MKFRMLRFHCKRKCFGKLATFTLFYFALYVYLVSCEVILLLLFDPLVDVSDHQLALSVQTGTVGAGVAQRLPQHLHLTHRGLVLLFYRVQLSV